MTEDTTDASRAVACNRLVRPWEAHEIDISAEQWHIEVKQARIAMRDEDERHRKVMEPLRRKLWELETSSFYWRSKMRAVYGIEL